MAHVPRNRARSCSSTRRSLVLPSRARSRRFSDRLELILFGNDWRSRWSDGSSRSNGVRNYRQDDGRNGQNERRGSGYGGRCESECWDRLSDWLRYSFSANLIVKWDYFWGR